MELTLSKIGDPWSEVSNVSLAAHVEPHSPSFFPRKIKMPWSRKDVGKPQYAGSSGKGETPKSQSGTPIAFGMKANRNKFGTPIETPQPPSSTGGATPSSPGKSPRKKPSSPIRQLTRNEIAVQKHTRRSTFFLAKATTNTESPRKSQEDSLCLEKASPSNTTEKSMTGFEQLLAKIGIQSKLPQPKLPSSQSSHHPPPVVSAPDSRRTTKEKEPEKPKPVAIEDLPPLQSGSQVSAEGSRPDSRRTSKERNSFEMPKIVEKSEECDDQESSEKVEECAGPGPFFLTLLQGATERTLTSTSVTSISSNPGRSLEEVTHEGMSSTQATANTVQQATHDSTKDEVSQGGIILSSTPKITTVGTTYRYESSSKEPSFNLEELDKLDTGDLERQLLELQAQIDSQQEDIDKLHCDLEDEVKYRMQIDEQLFRERKHRIQPGNFGFVGRSPPPIGAPAALSNSVELDATAHHSLAKGSIETLGEGGQGASHLIGTAMDAALQGINQRHDVVKISEDGAAEPKSKVISDADMEFIKGSQRDSWRFKARVQALQQMRPGNLASTMQADEYESTRVQSLLRDAHNMTQRFTNFCEYTLRAVVLQRVGLFEHSTYEPAGFREPLYLDGGHPTVQCATQHGGDARRVLDVVRGTLLFDKLEQVYEAVKTIVAADEFQTERVAILGIEDHFQDAEPDCTRPGPLYLIFSLDFFLCKLELNTRHLRESPALEGGEMGQIGDDMLLLLLAHGRLKDVNRLLQLKVDPNRGRTFLGQSCLHIAASQGDDFAVQALLKSKASVLAFDVEGCLPFHNCFLKIDPTELTEDKKSKKSTFSLCFTKLINLLLSDDEALDDLHDKAEQQMLTLPKRRATELILLAAERMLMPRCFLQDSRITDFFDLVEVFRHMDAEANCSRELSRGGLGAHRGLLHIMVSGMPFETDAIRHAADDEFLEFDLAKTIERLLGLLPSLDLNAPDWRGWTPLDHCFKSWGLEMAKVAAVLEKAGARHSLFWAASDCHPKTDEVLMNPTHGFFASLDMRDKEGNTALHVAALRRRSEACKVFISNGADASAKNSNGLTPGQLPELRQNKSLQYKLQVEEEKVNDFFVALRGGDGREAYCLEVVQNTLMRREPRVSFLATDSNGYTLLDAAVDGNKTEVGDLLRKSRVQHSLFWAIEQNDIDLLRMLLKGLADPFQRDCQGNTALHLATGKSETEMCEALLQHGAGLEHIGNRDGLTPISLLSDDRDHVNLHHEDLLRDVRVSCKLALGEMVRADDDHVRQLVHERRQVRQAQFEAQLQKALASKGPEALRLLTAIAKSGISQKKMRVLQEVLVLNLQKDLDLGRMIACVTLFHSKPRVMEGVCAAMEAFAVRVHDKQHSIDLNLMPETVKCFTYCSLPVTAALLEVITQGILSDQAVATALVQQNGLELICKGIVEGLSERQDDTLAAAEQEKANLAAQNEYVFPPARHKSKVPTGWNAPPETDDRRGSGASSSKCSGGQNSQKGPSPVAPSPGAKVRDSRRSTMVLSPGINMLPVSYEDINALIVTRATKCLLNLVRVTVPGRRVMMIVPTAAYTREDFVLGLLMLRKDPPAGETNAQKIHCVYVRGYQSLNQLGTLASTALKSQSEEGKDSSSDEGKELELLTKCVNYLRTLFALQEQCEDINGRSHMELCLSRLKALQDAKKVNCCPRHKLVTRCAQALAATFQEVVEAALQANTKEALREAIDLASKLKTFDERLLKAIQDLLNNAEQTLEELIRREELAARWEEMAKEAEEQARKLGHTDPEVRKEALEALGQLREVAGPYVDKIAGCLEDPVAMCRAAAARTLAQVGRSGWQYATTVANLILDPEKEVRDAVAESLCGMGDSGANAIVGMLSWNSPDEKKLAAVELLGTIGQSGHRYVDQVADLLGTAEDGPAESSWEIRRAALQTLGAMGTEVITQSERAMASMRIGMQDDTLEVQMQAVRIAGAMGDKGTELAVDLAELFRCEDKPELQAAAEDALRELDDAGAQAVAMLLKDETQSVRATARQALKRMGLPGARIVAELLLDTNPNVRSDAEFSLTKMGRVGTQVIAEMVVAREDESEEERDKRREQVVGVLNRCKQAGSLAIVDLVSKMQTVSKDDPQAKEGVRFILSKVTKKQAVDMVSILLDNAPSKAATSHRHSAPATQDGVPNEDTTEDTTQSVPVARSLSKPKPTNEAGTHEAAVWALAQTGDLGAKAVAEILKVDDPGKRAIAIAALENNTKGPAAVAELLTDDAPNVQENALNGLTVLGEVGANAAADMMAFDDPKFRIAGAACLPQMGDLGQAHAGKIRQLLLDKEQTVKEAAGASLSGFGPFGAQTVSEWLTDDNPKARAASAHALGNFMPAAPEYASEVAELLKDTDVLSRAAAEGALVKMGDEGVQSVVAQISDPDVEIRAYAAATLGRLGKNGCNVDSDVIAPLLSDEDPAVRLAAAEAIGNLGEGGAAHALTIATLLRDSDHKVRPAAASALSLLGAPGAGAIVTLLKDEDPKLREAAASVLGRMGKDGAKYAFDVARLLEDPDEGVQEVAKLTLSRFDTDGVAAVESLLEQNESGEPKTIIAAFPTLTHMMLASAVEKSCKEAAIEVINKYVVSFAGDKDPQVRNIAVGAIGELLTKNLLDPGNVMPLRRLSKALYEDADESVRKAAEQSLRLLPTGN